MSFPGVLIQQLTKLLSKHELSHNDKKNGNKQQHQSAGERVSLLTSKCHFAGSLTLETALVLPIFLFAMITLLYYGEVIRYTDTVASSLHQTAREMAVKAYATERLGVSGGGKVGSIAFSETYVRSKVSDSLSKGKMKEGEIAYYRSSIMKHDIIDLVAIEKIHIPYEFLGLPELSLMDRARVHAFTGYDPTGYDRTEDDTEEIVYITSRGSVYHRNRGCSHLKITVTQVSADSLDKMRNESGGKYYPCEYCHKKKGQGIYYLTNYGDRYHTTANCSALKRDITAVPISKVGGRGACKDCCY